MVCWFEELKAMKRIIVTLPGPPYDYDTSWDPSIIMTLPWLTLRLWYSWGISMIVLWHFLGYLYDCSTSWGILMIVTLPGASLWLWHVLGTSLWLWFILGLSMIVKLPMSLFMIMALPGASLLFWHFLRPLSDCNTSLAFFFLMIATSRATKILKSKSVRSTDDVIGTCIRQSQIVTKTNDSSVSSKSESEIDYFSNTLYSLNWP